MVTGRSWSRKKNGLSTVFLINNKVIPDESYPNANFQIIKNVHAFFDGLSSRDVLHVDYLIKLNVAVLF